MGDDERAEPPARGDLYSALGVPADASAEDIARAYRRLAREHHPDANPDAGADRFAGLTDAYDVLRDPRRRHAYDRTRGARADAAEAATGVRIPVSHVGDDEPAARPVHDGPRPDQPATHPLPELELPVSFEQAALGTTAAVQLDTDAACDTCAGAGARSTTCATCGGAGSASRASGGITIRHVCSDCDGRGDRPRRCDVCGGRGRRRVTREVNVRVPAGVDDGTRLRVRVSSADGPREMVAVVRTAPHPYFGRRGRDLTVRLPVTLAEAALGGVVTVPTLRDAVAIRIPPGTPHGRTFRVRGRGISFDDQPGDLLATVEIVVPDQLNDAQRHALEAFAAATESPRAHFERSPDRGAQAG